MASIADIIKDFDYDEDEMHRAKKFIPSLCYVSHDEAIKIKLYLSNYGIKLKPRDLKVLNCPFEIIKKRVDEIKSLGELEIYVQKPSSITSKLLLERLKKLQELSKPYKSANGKYQDIVYSQMAFNKKIGKNLVGNLHTEEKVLSKEKLIKQDEKQNCEDKKETNLDLKKITQKDLNDEELKKYDKLYNNLRNIISSIYDVKEVNENITNNLLKIITNRLLNDDAEILYASITSGKEINDLEKKQIKEAIKFEIENQKEDDVELQMSNQYMTSSEETGRTK